MAARCFATLSMTVLSLMLVPRVVTYASSPGCHPECSEGSVALGSEMLRYAQHDSAVTHAGSSGCYPLLVISIPSPLVGSA